MSFLNFEQEPSIDVVSTKDLRDARRFAQNAKLSQRKLKFRKFKFLASNIRSSSRRSMFLLTNAILVKAL
jgi:hypothetical protein